MKLSKPGLALAVPLLGLNLLALIIPDEIGFFIFVSGLPWSLIANLFPDFLQYSTLLNGALYTLPILINVFLLYKIGKIIGTRTIVRRWIIGSILVVIIVVVILISSIREVPIRTRDIVRINDIIRIQTALELYYNDNNEFPKTLDELASDYYYGGPPILPPDGDCSPIDNRFTYAPVANGYELTFCLGEETGKYQKGINLIKGTNF